jgi:dUTP pyrophosphatase
MTDFKIHFKKFDSRAKMPTQATEGDAGYDLYALDYTIINPFERKVVSTGIGIEIPKGYYGRIAPRSGLAVKKGIDVMAGVVDCGYRDQLGVVLINLNMLDCLKQFCYNPTDAYNMLFGPAGKFEIQPGDKIAQIIFEKCHSAEWVEVNELSTSERGTGGFGSSGR